DYENGGGPIGGYALNPITNQPYTPQIVKRGNYARVLAEFWADGLDSETPPGHWFEIYNHVSDDSLYEKRWAGQGPVLDDLEYDVKAYLTLGGSMHDAAISAWSHKGWYDYVRPVSAIRYMADQGQSSDTSLSNYSSKGIPLISGYIEVVMPGDTLAGANNEHVGKIKLYTWKGPGYIANPLTDMSGVGWILAENWWPYQRPTFVTPPFAGYISGHSTFSRTAAEVMTAMTGSPYFPGGMSNFVAEQNEFLKFEEGPSETIVLQWATYRDASDQCSLSRIWGGIHPPMDDIAGRKIGIELGVEAFNLTDSLYSLQRPSVVTITPSIPLISTANIGDTIHLTVSYSEQMDTTINPVTTFLNAYHPLINSLSLVNSGWLNDTTFSLSYLISAFSETINDVTIQFKSAKNQSGKVQNPYISLKPFRIDKNNPLVSLCNFNTTLINDSAVSNNLVIDIKYNEFCDSLNMPAIQFNSSTGIGSALTLNNAQSMWLNDTIYRTVYDVIDNNEIIDSIGIIITNANDIASNNQVTYNDSLVFKIDTKNPNLLSTLVSDNLLTINDIGSQAIIFNLSFDKPMNTAIIPSVDFTASGLLGSVLNPNLANTFWTDSLNCQLSFNLQNLINETFDIGIVLQGLRDLSGNSPSVLQLDSLFSIDTKRPDLISFTPSSAIIADASVGAGGFHIDISFNEKMNTTQIPVIELYNNGVLLTDAAYAIFTSTWQNDTTFRALFNVSDNNVEITDLALRINFAQDVSGNAQMLVNIADWINLDTKNPGIVVLSANTYVVNSSNSTFQLLAVFDEAIDVTGSPVFDFVAAQNVSSILSFNAGASSWINPFTYKSVYDVQNTTFIEPEIDVEPQQVFDMAGNANTTVFFDNYFSINYEPLGLSDVASNDQTFIYPNPLESGGILNLVSAQSKEQINAISIYSSDGKLVFNTSLNVGNNGVQSIAIPNLNAGVYFLIGNSDNIQKEWKLLIRK
ncbi:MAG: T9SS type A sorting domain-containing protein, partial [Sediminibacterium sp.]|nr:T9SS type A sorting domain-containing protein [Sediminibacterium sp.]